VLCLVEGFGGEGFIAVVFLCMQEPGCLQGFTHGYASPSYTLVLCWFFMSGCGDVDDALSCA
jgi:hypothetical protein